MTVLNSLCFSFRGGEERPNIDSWLLSVYKGETLRERIDYQDEDLHFACGATLLAVGERWALDKISEHRMDDVRSYTLDACVERTVFIPSGDRADLYLPAKRDKWDSSEWEIKDGKGHLAVFPYAFMGLDGESYRRKVGLSDLISVSSPILENGAGSSHFVNHLTKRIYVYMTIGDFLLEGPAFPVFGQEENFINPLENLPLENGIYDTLSDWRY